MFGIRLKILDLLIKNLYGPLGQAITFKVDQVGHNVTKTGRFILVNPFNIGF